MDGGLELLRGIAGGGHCKQQEQVRILGPRKAGKACGLGGNLLVADQAPIQSTGAPA